jgi:hypothetical protein
MVKSGVKAVILMSLSMLQLMTELLVTEVQGFLEIERMEFTEHNAVITDLPQNLNWQTFSDMVPWEVVRT